MIEQLAFKPVEELLRGLPRVTLIPFINSAINQKKVAAHLELIKKEKELLKIKNLQLIVQ